MEADLVPSPEAHERLELNNSPEYKLLCQHIRKILSYRGLSNKRDPSVVFHMDQDGPDVKRGDSLELDNDLNTCQDIHWASLVRLPAFRGKSRDS